MPETLLFFTSVVLPLQINSMVQGWRDMRALPHDTPAGDILACAYARTNPHLFEGRPRVSLMLQVGLLRGLHVALAAKNCWPTTLI